MNGYSMNPFTRERKMKNMQKSLFGMMALLALACAGCTPGSVMEDLDGDMERLPISMESIGGSKVYVESIDNLHGSLAFETGDSVYVNDGVFAVNMDGNPYVLANRSDNRVYRAIYPAEIVNTDHHTNIRDEDTVYVTIPMQQYYERSSAIDPATGLPKQKVRLPMISFPSGGRLDFKNICSLVRVTVQNQSGRAVNLSRLKLTSVPQSSSDRAFVSFAGDTRVSRSSNGTNNPVIKVLPPADSNLYGRSVTLHLNGQEARLSNGQSRNYYLVLAPFTMEPTEELTIAAYVSSSTDYVGIKSCMGVSLGRNEIATVTMLLR